MPVKIQKKSLLTCVFITQCNESLKRWNSVFHPVAWRTHPIPCLKAQAREVFASLFSCLSATGLLHNFCFLCYSSMLLTWLSMEGLCSGQYQLHEWRYPSKRKAIPFAQVIWIVAGKHMLPKSDNGLGVPTGRGWDQILGKVLKGSRENLSEVWHSQEHRLGVPSLWAWFHVSTFLCRSLHGPGETVSYWRKSVGRGDALALRKHSGLVFHYKYPALLNWYLLLAQGQG